ncbi:hypothetical protein NEFER03_2139 [Nematocida sp. LUAm3]|nr:hypothetical protein NEFER03_2139 [Nematocida sp. LUAm3]KAI5174610.1 hypothetical protein NEFER02_0731 [Nematocida sp. LUAm2]KAI5177984.1 hypothetical protein NEFER01_1166 [Nematocida sp. LUAm1]
MAHEAHPNPKKTTWLEASSLDLFLFPTHEEVSEWQVTKLLNDFEKRFIASGIKHIRVKGVIIRVSLKIQENMQKEKILLALRDMFLHTISVTVPPYILSDKEKFLLEAERISAWNGVHIESKSDNESVLFLSGTKEQILRARIDLFRMIEQFQGRETHVVSRYLDSKSLVETGTRVYFESKLFSKRALLSGVEADAPVCVRTNEEKLYKKHISVDKVKYIYSMIYYREELEEIASKHETYLEESLDAPTDSSQVSLVLLSLSQKHVQNAVLEVEMLYTTIVSVYMDKVDEHSVAKVFILQGKESVQVVGKTQEIKNMLREVDHNCTVHVDMSKGIEEFICGKKNGKINKVARESQCVLAVKSEAESILSIHGRTRNVEFALTLVEDELPAEYSFYLHEKHHKRIIGYGGKTIQRLMKKHGVYIKFDSSASSNHNVIIRTPKKNKESLQKMYKDVMDLSGENMHLLHGTWSQLSYPDFYSMRFDRYVLGWETVKVFLPAPLEHRYYLIPKAQKDPDSKAIATLNEGYVVASLIPMVNSTVITIDLWKKDHAMATYFSRDHGDPLFIQETLWNKRWKRIFIDSWHLPSWHTQGFPK